MNFANANAVNILHNSAGCKLKPAAIGIQLLEPLISFPITKVANINNKPLANKIFANAVKTLLSINKMKTPIKEQKIKKKNCLLYPVLPLIKLVAQSVLGLYSTMKILRIPIDAISKYNIMTARSVPLEILLL